MSKFKVGQKVRCIKACCGQFTKGNIYVVRRDDDHWVAVTADDGGRENGWDGINFEIIEPTPAADEFITTREIFKLLRPLDPTARARVLEFTKEHMLS